jgi:putative membrane protein insertion efficiency factor
MIARVEVFLIHLYRRFISPLKKGPTCRFVPTCSEYALEAIQLHGAVRGTYLAVRRVLRCNPLCKGGYDPVPR